MIEQKTAIRKTILDNGLTVLLREMHHAPVASFWIWYRVGSRNEHAGITGISHWVEHMLFKGTPTYPQGEFDKAVAREGGVFNGMTWIDFTTYFETLPSDRIDLALRVEADRMANAVFDPDETELERTVIISERQGNENDPNFLLSEALQAAAFQAHSLSSLGDRLAVRPRDDDARAALLALSHLLRAEQRHRGGGRRFRERRDAGPHRGALRPHPARPGAAAVHSAGAAPARRAPGHRGGAGHDFLPGSGLSCAARRPIPTSTRWSCSTRSWAAPKACRCGEAHVESQLAPLQGAGRNRAGGRRRLHDDLHHRPVSLQLLGHGAPGPHVAGGRGGAVGRDPTGDGRAGDASRSWTRRSSRRARSSPIRARASPIRATGWASARSWPSVGWFESFLDRLAAVTVADVQRVAQAYLKPKLRKVGWYMPTGDDGQETDDGGEVDGE